ncbi:MAG: hypothetical protein HYY84_15390 [Deltaproteobacteria bacterium]|nr:hypothetical protein [Deltaproteobacteria bacterium]
MSGRLGIALAVGFASACATQSLMVKAEREVRAEMARGNHERALKVLRDANGKGFRARDSVAYYMNEGMLLHLTGRYKESNAVFARAQRMSDDLYTKSVSKRVAATFTSDATLDYRGDDHERVLINVVKALNYLRMGENGGALVEARKIDERLKTLSVDRFQKGVYRRDAFASWLMGLLFEMEESWDDARIAYVKALDVYEEDFKRLFGMPVPPYVAEDVARAAVLSGDEVTAERMRARAMPARGVPGATALGADVESMGELLGRNGEVIVIHFNGRAPERGDLYIDCAFRSTAAWSCALEPGGESMVRAAHDLAAFGGTRLRVVFPTQTMYEPQNRDVTLYVGATKAKAHVAHPVARVANKVLGDRMHLIFRDTIVRAVTKTIAAKAAAAAGRAVGDAIGGKKKGWLASLFGAIFGGAASVAMAAVEESDKRSWFTLPARIEVARAIVPPGEHDVELRLPWGAAKRLGRVNVRAGERVVLTHHTTP